MNNRRTGVWILIFLFTSLGVRQFSQGVRSVDVLGLFASGALAGAAITAFWMTSIKSG